MLHNPDMLKINILSVPGIVIACCVGCANREAQTVNYAVRSAPSGERSALLDTAETVLVSLGYEIARRDTAGGVVVSEPMGIDRSGKRTVRADNPLRKVAEVRLAGGANQLKVHCKVLIQEQATDSFSFQMSDRSGDDVPGHHTAIDRDAATTAEQNSVWRTVRRDKTAEREILDQITEPADTP